MPKHCRTKVGELRLYHDGQTYMLNGAGLELPDDLAESIRPHVNVIVEEPEPAPASEPERKREKAKAPAGSDS